MIKGKKQYKKLYLLQSSTITHNATITTSSLSNTDITKLWYMNLGHLSEIGMAELSRWGLPKRQSTEKPKSCEHCVFGKQKESDSTKTFTTQKGH